MSGCSTVLLNPARCMRGSSFLRLLSIERLVWRGVPLLLLGADDETMRIRAGSSRCSCSSSATPSAC